MAYLQTASENHFAHGVYPFEPQKMTMAYFTVVRMCAVNRGQTFIFYKVVATVLASTFVTDCTTTGRRGIPVREHYKDRSLGPIKVDVKPKTTPLPKKK